MDEVVNSRTIELICKVADGLAAPEEEAEMNALTARRPELRNELALQKEIADTVRSVGLPELEDKVREQYWSGVYNRLEHRAGWTLVIIGSALVVGYAIYELMTEPDVHALYRIGLAALIVGFGVLFSGILRYRLRAKNYDKYREVVR